MTNTTALIIAAIVILILVIAVVALSIRAKKKKVSFTEKPSEQKEIDKSGSYTASKDFSANTFNFGTNKDPEKVPVAKEETIQKPQAVPVQLPVEESKTEEVEKTEPEQPATEEPQIEQLEQQAAETEPEAEHSPGTEESTTEIAETEEALEESTVEETAVETEPESIEVQTESEVEQLAETEAVEAETEAVTEESKPAVEESVAPVAGRLGRLRGRLARSQNVFSQGLLGVLTAGDLDEDAWEEIEDTLLMADLGTKQTMAIVEALRERVAEQGVSNEQEARALLRSVLIEACKPEADRSINVSGNPGVVLVVGVNGTGKTTTTGKIARVLTAMNHSVLLGAADTFRAAAADQLEMWGDRVGAETVRGPEGADPASVAFDAVSKGIEKGVDVVLIDTAGRLHTSVGLMDQLGKVKRVVEKKTKVDEVILVLDATIGQNGLMQAKTFSEVVDITGVALTKLDGSAKGGIVFQVQEELGVPVKLVGLGEGPDDLAPFEVEAFIDALLA